MRPALTTAGVPAVGAALWAARDRDIAVVLPRTERAVRVLLAHKV